jgi:hypothetical protein
MRIDGANAKSAGRRLLAGAERRRFCVLLGALLLMMLWLPAGRLLVPMYHPVLARVATSVLLTVMLLSAVFAVGRGRRSVMLAAGLAAPAVFTRGLNLFLDSGGMAVAGHLFDVLFLGYVVVVILAFLFTEQRVTSNTICASLCVYLLLGVLWADLYSLSDVIDPGSFSYPLAKEVHQARMRFGSEQSIVPFYFSLVTLTTLGYGDIVPVSAAARMLASVEAVVGQMYLAVLVARLVGLHISQSARDHRDPANRRGAIPDNPADSENR